MRARAALLRAALSDARALVSAAGDPDATVEALVDALALEPEPVLLVVDDVHNAGASAALVLRLVDDLPSACRVLVLGRRLPETLDGLRTPGRAVFLTGGDLAFTDDETEKLCRDGLAQHVSQDASFALRRSAGGWPVAVVLGALSLSRGAASLEQPYSVGPLVEQALARLPSAHRDALRQLGHLPWLTPSIASAATGLDDVVDAALRSGLPFTPRGDGSWELPGPVQEHLAASSALGGDVAGRAAAAFAELGEIGTALDVLLAAAEDERAAQLLATLTPEQIDRLDVAELSAAADVLSPGSIASHPEVLLHLARACEPAARIRQRTEALDRAAVVAAARADVQREIEVERARDEIRDGDADAAERRAARVLAEAPAGEVATRARALDVVGRVKAWRRDPASLAEAEPMLEEAYRLCLAIGRRSWAAQVVMPLAIHVHYARGKHELAVARIDDALARLPARSRHRAVMLVFRADTLVDCGRYEEAEANLREAAELGIRLSDGRVIGYAHWSRARIASQSGDAERTLAELRAAEATGGDWLSHETGTVLLSDAADLLSRNGDEALAAAYLKRAIASATQPLRALRIAEGAVAARQGDAEQAELILAELASDAALEPRERWRITLLRSEAARRAGSDEARPLAVQAFAEASEISTSDLPLIRERALTEHLRQLVGEPREGTGITVRALGAFEARRGSAPLVLPPGKPGELLRLLVASGGRLPADAAAEALWPEVDPGSGRSRLRVVLTRLRKAVGGAVARAEESLALASDVEVDAFAFEAEARRALAASDAAEARAALTRYVGTLLPDDLYAAWAIEPRERLARLHLSLLDLLSRAAEGDGEIDEAIRLLEEGVHADPFDESRYLRIARLSLAQGRRGRALDTLRRAAAALRELGLEPSGEHRALVRAAHS
jgi:DNA-binding SARP family transcriptional activator